MKVQEVYQITVEHYMQYGDGTKARLDQPIVIKGIYDRCGASAAILLNDMFDKLKDYALSKVREMK